jgi:hypothetical protein
LEAAVAGVATAEVGGGGASTDVASAYDPIAAASTGKTVWLGWIEHIIRFIALTSR